MFQLYICLGTENQIAVTPTLMLTSHEALNRFVTGVIYLHLTFYKTSMVMLATRVAKYTVNDYNILVDI